MQFMGHLTTWFSTDYHLEFSPKNLSQFDDLELKGQITGCSALMWYRHVYTRVFQQLIDAVCSWRTLLLRCKHHITCSNNDSLQARLAFRVPQEALSRACALQDFENSDHLDGIQNTRLMDWLPKRSQEQCWGADAADAQWLGIANLLASPRCYDIIKACLITSTIKEFYSPLEFLMS